MASLKYTTINGGLATSEDILCQSESFQKSKNLAEGALPKSGGSITGDINYSGTGSLINMLRGAAISDMPTSSGNLTYNISNDISAYGLKQYSKGIHISNGGSTDSAIMGVDIINNTLHWGGRVNNKWPNGVFHLGENKVLWSGIYYMSASHQITLSEKISQQVNGIVLVWSSYWNDTVSNDNFRYIFVPKNHVLDSNFAGKLVTMILLTGQFGTVASKGLYIGDTTITGHNDNTVTGTGSTSGIKFNNNAFVLRKVLGI